MHTILTYKHKELNLQSVRIIVKKVAAYVCLYLSGYLIPNLVHIDDILTELKIKSWLEFMQLYILQIMDP